MSPQTYGFILDSFTEIWEIKFGNIPFVAALVYDLQRYHIDFGIAVIDQVLEDIRMGMEVGHLVVSSIVLTSGRRRTFSSSTNAEFPPSNTLASCSCTVWSTHPSSLISCGRSYPLVIVRA